MGQGFVEVHRHRHCVGAAGGSIAQCILQGGLSLAQHSQLAALLQQPGQQGHHQVDAFLPGEPPHQAQQQRVGARGQAAALLQGLFVGGLVLQGVRAEGLGDQRVVLRVPHAGVDAVQDAVQALGLVAQHAVEAKAQRGLLDLAGVGGADGGDCVGGLQASLEHGHLAPVLHAVYRAPFGRDTELRCYVHGVHALEGQVVDGQDGGGAGACCIHRGLRQVQRRQAARPVVAMHHVGLPVGPGAVG